MAKDRLSIRTRRPGASKPWEARWRDLDGKQRSRSFRTKREAENHLATVKADMLRGQYVDQAAGKVRFRAYAEDWFGAQPHDVKTMMGLRSQLDAQLLPAFGDRQLLAIRPSTVQAWVGQLSRELAPSYVRLLCSTLSMILGAAVRDRLIPASPCLGVKLPTVSRRTVIPWSADTVEAVTAAMPQRYRAIVWLGSGCGLRQGEALGPRAQDVEFLHRRVQVQQQVKQVKGKGTVLALPKATQDALGAPG